MSMAGNNACKQPHGGDAKMQLAPRCQSAHLSPRWLLPPHLEVQLSRRPQLLHLLQTAGGCFQTPTKLPSAKLDAPS